MSNIFSDDKILSPERLLAENGLELLLSAEEAEREGEIGDRILKFAKNIRSGYESRRHSVTQDSIATDANLKRPKTNKILNSQNDLNQLTRKPFEDIIRIAAVLGLDLPETSDIDTITLVRTQNELSSRLWSIRHYDTDIPIAQNDGCQVVAHLLDSVLIAPSAICTDDQRFTKWVHNSSSEAHNLTNCAVSKFGFEITPLTTKSILVTYADVFVATLFLRCFDRFLLQSLINHSTDSEVEHSIKDACASYMIISEYLRDTPRQDDPIIESIGLEHGDFHTTHASAPFLLFKSRYGRVVYEIIKSRSSTLGEHRSNFQANQMGVA